MRWFVWCSAELRVWLVVVGWQVLCGAILYLCWCGNTPSRPAMRPVPTPMYHPSYSEVGCEEAGLAMARVLPRVAYR